jgi:hypothetical protein
MNKVFSLNEDYWTDDFSLITDSLIDRHDGDRNSIIGQKYYEGDKIPISTKELIDVDVIIDTINESVFEIISEWGEDYPMLDEQEKEELLNLLVGFLDKKHPHGFFHVQNICKKKITEKDLESGTLTGLEPEDDYKTAGYTRE